MLDEGACLQERLSPYFFPASTFVSQLWKGSAYAREPVIRAAFPKILLKIEEHETRTHPSETRQPLKIQ